MVIIMIRGIINKPIVVFVIIRIIVFVEIRKLRTFRNFTIFKPNVRIRSVAPRTLKKKFLLKLKLIFTFRISIGVPAIICLTFVSSWSMLRSMGFISSPSLAFDTRYCMTYSSFIFYIIGPTSLSSPVYTVIWLTVFKTNIRICCIAPRSFWVFVWISTFIM